MESIGIGFLEYIFQRRGIYTYIYYRHVKSFSLFFVVIAEFLKLYVISLKIRFYWSNK